MEFKWPIQGHYVLVPRLWVKSLIKALDLFPQNSMSNMFVN